MEKYKQVKTLKEIISDGLNDQLKMIEILFKMTTLISTWVIRQTFCFYGK